MVFGQLRDLVLYRHKQRPGFRRRLRELGIHAVRKPPCVHRQSDEKHEHCEHKAARNQVRDNIPVYVAEYFQGFALPRYVSVLR